MAKPAVIVVGADKGGVGKTTVSRTVLDYFSANNVPTRAFDTESPRGTLKRFHPDITEIVDVTSTSDQMKIFDTLNTASTSVTVIDVRAGLLSPTLASLRDIGFLDAAKSGQITFAVFHILGPSIASLDEIAETANFMQGAKYFLVKNFINNTSFFEWDQATYNSYFHRIKDATELTIPKLNEMAYEQVEVASVPFLKFVANKGVHDETENYSFVLRGYVRHWLAAVWSEFDRIKLTDIVGSKDSRKSRPAAAARSSHSRHSGTRHLARGPESITTIECMDSGPAPQEAHPGMTTAIFDRPRYFIRYCADAPHARLHHLLAPPAGRQDADRAAAQRIPGPAARLGDRLRHQFERAVAARLSAETHRNRRCHRHLRQDAADGPPDPQ